MTSYPASKSYIYDVYLSFNGRDRNIAGGLADRLRSDGLRVWHTDSVVRPGEIARKKLDETLEQSRVFLACISANTSESDWTQIVAHSLRFRDPMDRDRQFIPLRLDASLFDDALAQVQWLDWSTSTRKLEYPRLVELCKSPVEEASLPPVSELKPKLKHGLVSATNLLQYDFGGDWKQALGCGGALRLWDLESGACIREFGGGTDYDWCLAWCTDRKRFVSGGRDDILRLWDVDSPMSVREVRPSGYGGILSLSWGPDQETVLAGFGDGSIWLWNVASDKAQCIHERRGGAIQSIAWSPDGSRALSGGTIRPFDCWTCRPGVSYAFSRGMSGLCEWLDGARMDVELPRVARIAKFAYGI
jgi:hypothetical protein